MDKFVDGVKFGLLIVALVSVLLAMVGVPMLLAAATHSVLPLLLYVVEFVVACGIWNALPD